MYITWRLAMNKFEMQDLKHHKAQKLGFLATPSSQRNDKKGFRTIGKRYAIITTL